MLEKNTSKRFPSAESITYRIYLLTWGERALELIRQVIIQCPSGLSKTWKLKTLDELKKTHILPVDRSYIDLTKKEAAEFQRLLVQAQVDALAQTHVLRNSDGSKN